MKKIRIINAVSAIILVSVLSLMTVMFFNANGDDMEARAANKNNGEDVYNILFLGRDAAANLSDVIMLVSLDMRTGNATIMQVPRDTYFSIEANDGGRINVAPRKLGVEKFSSVFGDALGLDIDFYFSLDIETVKEIVDTLSGVEIDVPFDMEYDDPAQDLTISLKKGKRVLNGNEALGFIRYRTGYVTGDLGRLDAQKLFIDALGKRVSEIKNPIVIFNLFKLISSHGMTNITEQEIISLGVKSSKLKGGEVRYLTAPGEAIQSEQSGAWYYVLSGRSMQEVLCQYFGLSEQEKSFDKENKFVDKRVKSFYDIYNKRVDYVIYSAKEIENIEININ